MHFQHCLPRNCLPKKRLLIIPVLLLTALRASTLVAHPGHGTNGGSDDLTHYLFDPAHAIGIVGAIGVAVLLFLRRSSRPSSARSQ